jgi:hypothetical protein
LNAFGIALGLVGCVGIPRHQENGGGCDNDQRDGGKSPGFHPGNP